MGVPSMVLDGAPFATCVAVTPPPPLDGELPPTPAQAQVHG
jgi:hypothetical protein